MLFTFKFKCYEIIAEKSGKICLKPELLQYSCLFTIGDSDKSRDKLQEIHEEEKMLHDYKMPGGH